MFFLFLARFFCITVSCLFSVQLRKVDYVSSTCAVACLIGFQINRNQSGILQRQEYDRFVVVCRPLIANVATWLRIHNPDVLAHDMQLGVPNPMLGMNGMEKFVLKQHIITDPSLAKSDEPTNPHGLVYPIEIKGTSCVYGFVTTFIALAIIGMCVWRMQINGSSAGAIAIAAYAVIIWIWVTCRTPTHMEIGEKGIRQVLLLILFFLVGSFCQLTADLTLPIV